MDFIENYKSILDKREKADLRNEIISRCKVNQSSFYQWIYRKKYPAYAKRIISELMKLPQTELFPTA